MGVPPMIATFQVRWKIETTATVKMRDQGSILRRSS